MIRKLKLKVILMTTISLWVLLTALVVSMNITNYTAVVHEADEILSILSLNDGSFSGLFDDKGFASLPDMPDREDRLPEQLSPETPYESRYFFVLLRPTGETVVTDVRKIAAVDEKQAVEYARQATDEKGFVGDFRYIRAQEPDGLIRVTFLDCGRRLAAFRTFLYSSITAAFGGYLVVFALIFFLAGRIVRPLAQSYEKQKRFITDAGHEMKTPLTIISANTDLLEMELGDNESLTDIRQQTKRLAELTNDLVSLARMEEAETSLPKLPFPVSEVVQEAAEPYRNLFTAAGKAVHIKVQPMLTLNGSEQAIRQLIGILLDNALKYSAPESRTSLLLARQGSALQLTVENPVLRPMAKEELELIFDRFYRPDSDRNSATGGHGIGLSMAKAAVTAHNGKISARQEGNSFSIIATFPL